MTANIKNKFVKNIVEWAIAIVIALLVFLVLDNFVVKSARVEGSSMQPTFFHGDRVLVNRFVYLIGEPQIGDVIAFPYAADPSNHYIKRIIGMPGDVMDFADGFIYRNGVRLDDEFSYMQISPGTVIFPLIVESDAFFVLGDNRRISEDSRFVGVGNVPRHDIIGRVNFRWLPLNNFGFVE